MIEKNQMNVSDSISMNDRIQNASHDPQLLRGEINIYRRNKQTGEVSFWDHSENIISISGMQWILMKMFGLYLDAPHGVSYEDLGRDTTVVIPELNQSGSMGIGTDPASYTLMSDNISARHFIQGFMIGNGGSGEDQMTTKNTDYSFVRLRNPIPFQQTDSSLNPDIAGKYLGELRVGNYAYTHSYFIKKFESTPHIYHGWWRDGEKWDYSDPITADDLGPDAPNGAGKTSRIESYVECELSLDESDCVTYFGRDGNTQTPAINELGLVAFDTTANGTRVTMEYVYYTYLKTVFAIIFDNNRHTESDIAYMKTLIDTAISLMDPIVTQYSQSNMNALYELLTTIASATTYNFSAYQSTLGSESTITLVALYDQYGNYVGETDQYLTILSDSAFDSLTNDEAQRIKLITYYTFKAIPIEENWETLINYRIYAN